MITKTGFPMALRAVAVGLMLLTFGCAAFAQSKPSAEAVETARQIIKLKGGDKMFGAIIPGVVEQGKAMFEQQNPALSKDLGTVAGKLREQLAPRAAELDTQIATAYASHFTDKELKEILAFYQSPIGIKMINEEPQALAAGINFAQGWANKLSDEVITKYREEMKKLGHDI